MPRSGIDASDQTKPVDSEAEILAYLVARADAERDDKRQDAAAILYEEVLRLRPDDAGMHVQRAHMLKETGRFDLAEHHYLEARRRTPNDADLALQFGHLYKVVGRYDQAREAYRAAARLQPGWAEPSHQLEELSKIGWRHGLPTDLLEEGDAEPTGDADLDAGAFDRLSPAEIGQLVFFF